MARKKYDDDDGRVISNMNVQGMPWNNDAAESSSTVPDGKPQEEKQYNDDLTKSETAAIMWGAIKAALLISLVFSVAGVLIVLAFIYYNDFIAWITSIFS